METSEQTPWGAELGKPSSEFFRAFAARVQAEDGVLGAVRDAVVTLVPQVDWPAYLPHVPHGLLGLQAVLALEPLLARASFLRILATQLHAFALEARSPAGHGLGRIGKGSGHWGNLQMALEGRRPSIAWGEALGMAEPGTGDFRRLEAWAEGDMANVGHKAVLARGLADLASTLDHPPATRLMLALTAWLCASEPVDTFWRDRALRRLEGVGPVPFLPAAACAEVDPAGVRAICDTGLVELLDQFSGRVRAAAGSGELLAMLVLAASEKQLDARRDLEGRTAWTFVFLAALARRAAEAGPSLPATWVQAAALVNLFPTGEEEERPTPAAPRGPAGAPGPALLEAVLDGEPQQAMHLAAALGALAGPEAVLRVLAEAASANDPSFNHSHQLLAVAAARDLVPMLPSVAQVALLVAMAKFLANAQGSSDLGRLAQAAIKY